MNIVKKPLVSFIVFILLSVAILAGGSFFFIHETNSDVNTLNKNFLSEIAEQNANMMKKIVEMQLDKVSAVSNVLTNEPNLTQERIIEVLTSESQRSSFKRMGHADVNGYAITSDGQTIDIGERAYFKEAIQGINSVSDRLVDKVGGAYINVYAVPFYQNGDIAGVIFATNDSENFIDLLDSKTFNGLGYSYVVKKDGSPIAYPTKEDGTSSDLTRIFKEIDKTQIGKDKTNIIKDGAATEQDGYVSYAWNGVERIGAYSKVGIKDWYAVTLVPKSAITSNTDRLVFRNILLVLLTASIFIIFLVVIILQGRKSRQELEKIAYVDEITGSPNFKAFKKLAQKKLDEHCDFPYIFVMFDIENFKFINDRFGYKMGNDVLNSIANSLEKLMHNGIECYARVAADEFVIMLREKHENFLEEIRSCFVNLFNQNTGSDFNHLIRFHSGVYVSDRTNHDFESIYEKVNYAHRQSKLVSSKEDITEFLYNDDVKKKAMKRIEIEDTMANALRLEEFEVFIQPKYCLKNELIAGGEALVRWRLKDGTLRYPGDFIPLFEENAFIIKLDMYMFEQICKLLQKWKEEGIPPICISVNFSRLHLFNSKFISELVELSDKYNVARNLIELELTETIFLENENLLDSVLEEAHEAGFTISMDDFGNGYSSLGLLKNINVDVIKVDRKFFVDDKDEQRTKIVVEYVMKMAQKLGVHTLAEGIETKDHIDMLKDIGCEYVQGYYYAKPMPAHDFEQQLREQNERGRNEL